MRYFQFKPILLEYKRDITSTRYGEKLLQLGNQQGIESLEEVLSTIEGMDPTNNKQYVEWLVRNFIAGKFRLEDSPRVRDDLQTFISVKNRLPADERDLGRRDRDYSWLKGRIDQINNVEIGGDKPASDTGTFPVVENSKVLYNGPLGQLAIPETAEASCELGRGTRWCTASRGNTMFNYYSKESPLYTWRDKNGEKYQFHFGNYTQMMDASDNEIDQSKINSFWIHPVIGKLFKQNIDKIELRHLSEKLKTPERCMSAVKQYGLNLKYVPEKLKTPEMCEQAVELNGVAAIKYMPDKLLSTDLYMKLVDKHGPIKFEDVPDKFKTPEMCAEVGEYFERHFDWSYEPSKLKYIPDKFKTPEMCKRAVSADGLALEYVPEDMKTREICLTAGEENGFSSRFLPEKLKTPEFYKALVKLDGRALGNIPAKMKTPELCKLAIKNNWLAFYSIPDDMKTLKTYADILVSNVFSPAMNRNMSDDGTAALERRYNPMLVVPDEYQAKAKKLAYHVMAEEVLDNPSLLEKIKNNLEDSFWFKKGDIEKIKSLISSNDEFERIQNKMSNDHRLRK